MSGGLDGARIHEVGAVDSNGNFLRIPKDFATGELGALTAARDAPRDRGLGALDTLASTLRDSVNAIQTARRPSTSTAIRPPACRSSAARAPASCRCS